METMPPKISEAITAVMTEVRVLQKGDQNKHGGYAFASIDKFLEIVGGACAKAGLIIMQDEIETEILPMTNKRGEPSPWLRAKYEFWLSHESGEFMERSFIRTVMVPASGGQAFGSAQSYTLKQFQRSLFQIATGDKDDVDFLPNEDIGVDTSKKSPTAADWKGPLGKTALKNKMRDFAGILKSCETRMAVESLTEEYAEILDQCEIDLPEWYSGKGDKPGAKQNINQMLTELPGDEEVSDLMVPVPPMATGEGVNWPQWRDTVEGIIDNAKTLELVNEIAAANKAAFGNYSKAQPRNAESLKTIIDNKRGFFAAEPKTA